MKKLLTLFLAILLSGTVASSAVPLGLTLMGGDGTSGEGGGCSDSGSTIWFIDGAEDGSEGFESPFYPDDGGACAGSLGNWDACDGSPARELIVDDGIVKKGTQSLLSNSTDEKVSETVTTRDEFWIDYWVYLGTSANVTSHFSIIDWGVWTEHHIRVQPSDGSLEYYFDGNNLDSEVDLTDETWYHIFIHFKDNGASGTDVVQIAIETTDTRSGWDVDVANLTNTVVERDTIQLGARDPADTVYLDAFRSWYGSDEPCEWQP